MKKRYRNKIRLLTLIAIVASLSAESVASVYALPVEQELVYEETDNAVNTEGTESSESGIEAESAPEYEVLGDEEVLQENAASDFEFVPGDVEVYPSYEMDSLDDFADNESGEDSVVYETFESRYIPKVDDLPNNRSQSPYGSCWAHAAIGVAEINAIKQGLYDKNINMSESQLAYFTRYLTTDPLGGTEGDMGPTREYDKEHGYSFINSGGNAGYGGMTLMSWAGVATENNRRLSYDENVIDDIVENGFTDSEIDKYAYNSDAIHVRNMYKIFVKEDSEDEMQEVDRTAVKAMIKKNGATTFSYNHNDKYYDLEHNSYYSEESNTNHAVIAVGWDDDFPAENFDAPYWCGKRRPEGNGAWLIRNSWNNGVSENLIYNDTAYFWVSYYDKSINNIYAFDVESADKYENCYQYDGVPATGVWGGEDESEGVNFFTAAACEEGEKLDAVAFYVTNTNAEYTVEIYKNAKTPDDLTEQNCVSAKSGSTTMEGYYTVDLEEPVPLAKGDKYAVLIKLQKEGSIVSQAYEETNTKSAYFKYTAYAESGQSYIRKKDGEWQDITTKGEDCGNLRIKALTTNNNSTQKLELQLESETGSEGKVSLRIGKHYLPAISVSPAYKEKAALETLTFTSDYPEVAAVDNESGLIAGKSVGEATITVTENITGESLEIPVVVKGYNPEEYTDYEIYSEKDFVGTDETLQFAVYSENSETIYDNADFYWTVSDNSIATIDENGLLTARKPGKVKVLLSDNEEFENCKEKVIKVCVGMGDWNAATEIDSNDIDVIWKDVPEVLCYWIYYDGEKIEELPPNTHYYRIEKNDDIPVTKKVRHKVAVIPRRHGISSLNVPNYCYYSPTVSVNYILGDGGAGAGDNFVKIRNDSIFKLRPAIPQEEYTFEGWYSDSSYTDRVYFAKQNIVSEDSVEDITLYAKFAKVSDEPEIPDEPENPDVPADDPPAHECVFKDYKSDNNATCTKDGTKTARCIYDCGNTDTKIDTGSRLAHTYSIRTVVRDATYNESGLAELECSVCHSKQTEIIPKLEYTASVVKNENNYKITLVKGARTATITDLAKAKGEKKWSVVYSQKGIAAMSKKGAIKAKKPGSTVATVTTEHCIYTVNIAVENPGFERGTLTINKGNTLEDIGFSGTTLDREYKSSKTKVAVIDAKTGKLTAVAKGKTKITVIVAGKKYSRSVKVID